MKLRKKELDIFNLSFLDIISCGFGAVVMLVLISKPHDDVSIAGKEEVSDLLQTVITLENSIAEVKNTIASKLTKSNQLSNEQKRLESASTKLDQTIQQQQENKPR